MKYASLIGLALLTALPATAADLPEVKGFQRVGAGERYDRKNVFEAINGAAEIYMAYGFAELRMGSYRAGKLEVGVQVFDLKAPINAFGIFRRERPPKAVAASIGTEGASSAWSCLGYKGRFFLKAEPTDGKLDRAGCERLLGGIAQALPGDAAAPAELAALPTGGRKPGSLGYTSRGFLGVRELQRCLHATYVAGGKEHVRFVVVGDGEAAWKRLQAAGWKPGKLDALPQLGKTIPYRGTVTVVRTPEGGVIGTTATGALLNATIRELARAAKPPKKDEPKVVETVTIQEPTQKKISNHLVSASNIWERKLPGEDGKEVKRLSAILDIMDLATKVERKIKAYKGLVFELGKDRYRVEAIDAPKGKRGSVTLGKLSR